MNVLQGSRLVADLATNLDGDLLIAIYAMTTTAMGRQMKWSRE